MADSILGGTTGAATNAPATTAGQPPVGTQATPSTAGTIVPETTEAPVYIKGDGTFDKSWTKMLPQELQADNTLNQISDIKQMAKMLVNAEKLIGKKKIALPDQYAKPEEKDEFYRAIGRPDTPEGYKLERGQLPEGVPNDPQTLEWFKGTAHKLGLSQEQASNLLKEYDSYNGKMYADFQKITADVEEKAVNGLKQEWGAEFESKTSKAVAMLDKLGMKQEVIDAGLGNNVAVIKLLATIADKAKEEVALGLTTKVMGGAPNIAELQAHPAYLDAKHPQHNQIIQQILKMTLG